ncbi:hypothetical protein QEN19_003841 [Hanseniaspora menglaensis]
MLCHIKFTSSAHGLKSTNALPCAARYSVVINSIPSKRFISHTQNKKDQLFSANQISGIQKVTNEDIQGLNHPKMNSEYSPSDVLSAYQFNLDDLSKNSNLNQNNDPSTENLSLFLKEQRNKYVKMDSSLNQNFLSSVDSSLKVKDYDETIKTRQDVITTKINFFNSAIANNMFLTAFNLLIDLKKANHFSERQIFEKYMVYLTSLVEAKEAKMARDKFIECPVVGADGIMKVISKDIERGYAFTTITNPSILALQLQQIIKTAYKNNFEGLEDKINDTRVAKAIKLIKSNLDIMSNIEIVLKEEEYISYDTYKVVYMIPEFKDMIPESVSSSIKEDFEAYAKDLELIENHRSKDEINPQPNLDLSQKTLKIDDQFMKEYVDSFISKHTEIKAEKLEVIRKYKLAEKSTDVLKKNVSTLVISESEKFEVLKFFQDNEQFLLNKKWIEVYLKSNGEDFFELFKCIPYENKDLQKQYNELLEKINLKRQLLLEEGCVKSGEIVSVEKSDEEYPNKITHYNSEMSDMLNQWQKQMKSDVEVLSTNPNTTSIVISKANEIYKDLSPEVMSTLTVFAILKEMSFYKNKHDVDSVEDVREIRLATVAAKIGQAVCAEYTRYRMKPSDLKLLGKIRPNTAQFKRFYNKIYSQESHLLIDSSIMSEVEINVGATLLDIFLERCTVTLFTKLRNEKFEVAALKRSYETSETGAVGILNFHPSVVKKMIHTKESAPVTLHLLPMLCSPKKWTNHEDGGYLTTRNSLLRTNKNVEQLNYLKQVCCEEGSKIPIVLSGVNTISRTAWTINKDVLKVILHLWNTGKEFGSIPPANFFNLTDPKNPNNLMNLDINDETILPAVKFAKKKELNNMRQKFFSIRCTESYKIELARAFCGEKMYFPHTLDFRGRAYPINVYLNQLGNDLSRGLIKFWEGKPLGDRGLTWLKIHLGNCFGMSKKIFDERIKFCDENISDILKDCENPLRENAFWRQAEDEFQALATIIEIGGALNNPEGIEKYICHLPVHQDGSCNGLQHYAALGGDIDGAFKVNLLPSERPQDVYTAVCDIVNRKVKEDFEANQHDDVYVDRYEILKNIITRKVVKQPVMTTVYGVTAFGAKLQVAKQLMKLKEYNNDKSLTLRHGFYIATKIFDSIKELFSNAEKIQDWLGQCSKLISKSLVMPKINDLKKKKIDVESVSTLIWTTPLGLPVVHPYRVSSKFTINTSLQSVSFTKKSSISKVDVSKQSNAFAPNYVHSLDASHMLLTAHKCFEDKITFSSVHDSYWSLAADADAVGDILRTKFVELHSADLIAILREEFKTRYKNNVVKCRFMENSPLADEIRNYRLQFKKRVGHKPTIKDELTLESFRLHLLSSEVPEEVLKGKQMTTLISILETYDPEEVKSYMISSKEKVKSKNFITGYVPIEFPAVPTKGDLNLDDVKKSLYFFS